jgi:hypothetical protein
LGRVVSVGGCVDGHDLPGTQRRRHGIPLDVDESPAGQRLDECRQRPRILEKHEHACAQGGGRDDDRDDEDDR